VALLLESFDHAKLVFRKNAGINREMLGTGIFGDLTRRADGALQPNGRRDGPCGGLRVAGHHDGAHAEGIKLGQQAVRVWSGRIVKAEQPDDCNVARRTATYGRGFGIPRRRAGAARRKFEWHRRDGRDRHCSPFMDGKLASILAIAAASAF
jgi:hypothetical protein